ncbi:DUF6431 domain-containing protein [Candidatus Uabimicrobium sp. HlEnr_7]|uniref:DUF6431 domain-containing protein n=1 Tax=Candidatus Uabimicrobium helgolandensis TaxID=3095367 RepID=UPI0035576364
MIIVKQKISVKEYLALGLYVWLEKPKKCPTCKTENSLKRIGYYTRWICGKSEEILARIGRVQCKNCKISHGLLPWFLIPRKQETTEIIARFLQFRILENMTLKKAMEESGSKKALRQKGAKWITKLWEKRKKLKNYMASIFNRFSTVMNKILDEKRKILYPLIHLIFEKSPDISVTLSYHNERFHKELNQPLI